MKDESPRSGMGADLVGMRDVAVVRCDAQHAARSHYVLTPSIRTGFAMASSADVSIRRPHAPCSVAGNLALVLAACASAPSPATSSATNPAAAPACPVETFDRFIERFSHDNAFQRRTTADPLIVERNAAEPVPGHEVDVVALADVAWPGMPGPEHPDESGRIYEIARRADTRMDVRIRTPDTSDQQTCIFGQPPGWQLQRVIDESI